MLGFGLSVVQLAVRKLLGSPAGLFATGVNGAWYDPSDFSTMFQDAAGTTPVTAVGQPVGLMLDKSKGLVLGPNVCTTSYPITGSANGAVVARMGSVVAGMWYKFSYTVSASTTTGTLYFEPTGGPFAYQVLPTAVGTYTVYAYAQDSELTFAGITLGGFVVTGSITLSSCTIQAIPGNHAYNSSGNSANFPVLSARYNLLTKTEDFSDAVWNKSSGYTTITADAADAPDGTITADKLIANATNNAHLTYQSFNYGVGSYRLSLYVKAAEYSKFRVQGNSSTTGAFANFDLSTGTYSGLTLQGSGWTNIAASVLNVGNGWYLCSITFDSSVSVAGQYYASMLDNSGNSVFTGDGTSGIYIWGADLRVANDALNQPAYQRVNTATDYDTVGFKPYLSFNGVNQWLQTNSIDFTYGDKMFVCAGVRKLSDATIGMIAEISAGDAPGSCQMYGYGSAYTFASIGTAGSSAGAYDYPSPITNVVSGIGNIAGDQAILRVNGSQVASSTADQGTGSYGNYPLYLGARSGSSLWFNGRLYGLVVAGKAASASEIASTEAWLNQKTGAYEGTPGSLSLDLNFTDNTYYSRVI